MSLLGTLQRRVVEQQQTLIHKAPTIMELDALAAHLTALGFDATAQGEIDAHELGLLLYVRADYASTIRAIEAQGYALLNTRTINSETLNLRAYVATANGISLPVVIEQPARPSLKVVSQ